MGVTSLSINYVKGCTRNKRQLLTGGCSEVSVCIYITGMRPMPLDLSPFLISQGASEFPSFSNPGAYIPFTRSYPSVNFKLSTIIILIPEIHEKQHGSTSLQHDLDTYSGG